MSLEKIKQIGIVGGSASSLMLCIEAAKAGIRTCVLDPKVDCVAGRAATEHIIAAINNENLKKLSLRCDCVIYNTRPDFEIDTKLHSKLIPSKADLNELYNFKNVLEILELLEIPTAHIYYQDNNQDAFKEVNGLTMPFRFIKLYKNFTRQMDIFTKEDLSDFIMEMEEEAEGFILQPISDYKQIAACICVVDEAGRIYQYQPIEECSAEGELCHLRIGDGFSKNLVSKLSRYNRKLLKEIQAAGVYTIKYGVKSNKSVEFIEITPELGAGSILTEKAYDHSAFNMYLQMVTDRKPAQPEMISFVQGVAVSAEQEKQSSYEGDFYQCGIADLYVQREKEE